MPLVCDATALVALGSIDSIDLLKHLHTEIVISPWVKERELRRFSEQTNRGIEESWIRVQEPSASEVRDLTRAVSGQFKIDQGEAETLVIAARQEGQPTTLLIDEGEAFLFAQRVVRGRDSTRQWRLVCLADILHDLETNGAIDSAAEIMQRLSAYLRLCFA